MPTTPLTPEQEAKRVLEQTQTLSANRKKPYVPKYLRKQPVQGFNGANLLDPKTQQQVNKEAALDGIELTPSSPSTKVPPMQGASALPVNNNPDWFNNVSNKVATSQKALDDAVADDEQARKSEKSRKNIAAIADAIAGVANMVGTARGAYAMNFPSASQVVGNRVTLDQRYRTANINQLRSRLDAAQNSLNNALIQKDAMAQRAWQAGLSHSENMAKIKAQNERYERQDQLNRDKFEYGKEKDSRTFEIKEKGQQQQYELGKARIKASNYATSSANERAANSLEWQKESFRMKQEAEKKKAAQKKAMDSLVADKRTTITNIKNYYGPYQGMTDEQKNALNLLESSDNSNFKVRLQSLLDKDPELARELGIGSADSDSMPGVKSDTQTAEGENEYNFDLSFSNGAGVQSQVDTIAGYNNWKNTTKKK